MKKQTFPPAKAFHVHRLLAILTIIFLVTGMSQRACGQSFVREQIDPIHNVVANATASQPAVYYVTPNGSGNKSGTDWANASNDLQASIINCSNNGGGQVWVKNGVYTPPASSIIGTDPRTRHFELRNNVAVYGGFQGNETAVEQRDFNANTTILSGDFQQNDLFVDNSYHVICNTSGIAVNETAILDGFSICNGNANGDFPNDSGGGIYMDGCKPKICNCLFTGNEAIYGGAVDTDNGAPSFSDCKFEKNVASMGGVVYSYSSSPTFSRCSFNNNMAFASYIGGECGGAIYNDPDQNSNATLFFKDIMASSNYTPGGGGFIYSTKGSINFENATFYKNNADGNGGVIQMQNGTLSLLNSTFYNNYADGLGSDCYLQSGSASVNFCTFCGETSHSGTGAVIYSINANYNIKNSIIWPDNAASALKYNFETNAYPFVSYCVVKGGYYNDNPTKYPGINDAAKGIRNTDPLLLPFGTYGGYAMTLPVSSSSSSAIGGADPSILSGTDQRGLVRDVPLDAGATEYQTFPTSVMISSSNNFCAGIGYKFNLKANCEGDNLTFTWYQGQSGDKSTRIGTGQECITPGVYQATDFWVLVTAPKKSLASQSITVRVVPVLYVSTTGSDGNSGDSWATAKRSFKAALALSASGNEIWVAEGTYQLNDNDFTSIDYSPYQLCDSVKHYGGFSGLETSSSQRNLDLHPTILSGTGGPGPVIYNTSNVPLGPNTLLDGFIIQGGYSCGLKQEGSTIHINNCKFCNNQTFSQWGGGISLKSVSNAVIENCEISGNTASDSSSGAFADSVGGGGLYILNSMVSLSECKVQSNSAQRYGYAPGAFGGGIYGENSSVTLTNCDISCNSVAGTGWNYAGQTKYYLNNSYGGAAYIRSGSISAYNCSFISNSAANNKSYQKGSYGGAIYCSGSMSIVNSLFDGNDAASMGGAIVANSPSRIIHCTFSNNTSGANTIYGSNCQIYNSILWNPSITTEIPSGSLISYSIVKGGYSGGTQVLNADPLLQAVADNGGPTLSRMLGANSPAIDAGSSSVSTTWDISKDQRGFPRDSQPDMGSCEFGAAIPSANILLSGNLGFGNVTLGSNVTGTLTISNNGNASLSVSSINYPSGFSGTWTGIISPNGTQNVIVTFAPQSAQSYSGTITVISNAAAGNNTIACSGTGIVFVPDTTPPVISVPADMTVEATGANGAVVTFTTSAVDAVSGTVSTTNTPSSGSVFSLGTTTVNVTASDAAGNIASKTFKVTVKDTNPPMIEIPPDKIAEATGSNGAVVTFTTLAFDAVSGVVSTINTPASGSIFSIGTTTVTILATDAAGNTASATFKVTVKDTTSPMITVPADMTVEATGSNGAVVTFNTSAVDAVSGTVATTISPVSGAVFPLGTTTVTVTASDAAGNNALKTFKVTVKDTTPPVITVPADLTVNASGSNGAVVTFTTLAVDAVSGTVATSNSPASGSLFPIGTTTVNVTAGDAAGNSASKTFAVKVTNTGTRLVITGTPNSITVPVGSPNGSVDMSQYIKDPNVLGTVVRLSCVYATAVSTPIVTGTRKIDIALFDQGAPITVANFLSYISAKAYDSSFIHRSVKNFVIQGGGYTVTGSGTSFSLGNVPQAAPILNEFSAARSNIAGTIAMALSGTNPNSATNQWFINLVDNSSSFDHEPFGGYTVFGKLLGDGLSVANQIAGLPIFNCGSPFDQLPLGGRASTDSSSVLAEQLVRISTARVIPAITFSVVSDNTGVAIPSISNNGTLTLQYKSPGLANITVTATDLDGADIFISFPVFVTPPIGEHEKKSPQMMISGNNAYFTVKSSVLGRRYQLQYSDNLASGSWKEFGSVQIGNASDLIISMPIDNTVQKRFFRVKLN